MRICKRCRGKLIIAPNFGLDEEGNCCSLVKCGCLQVHTVIKKEALEINDWCTEWKRYEDFRQHQFMVTINPLPVTHRWKRRATKSKNMAKYI